MNSISLGETIARKFKVVVVIAVAILLLLSVTIAIFVLYALFINGLRSHLVSVHSVGNMQGELQRVFAGVLLVLLGLELLEK
jgi:membrane-anchored protein YejM (alkaline phosphatase superfamily)